MNSSKNRFVYQGALTKNNRGNMVFGECWIWIVLRSNLTLDIYILKDIWLLAIRAMWHETFWTQFWTFSLKTVAVEEKHASQLCIECQRTCFPNCHPIMSSLRYFLALLLLLPYSAGWVYYLFIYVAIWNAPDRHSSIHFKGLVSEKINYRSVSLCLCISWFKDTLSSHFLRAWPPLIYTGSFHIFILLFYSL